MPKYYHSNSLDIHKMASHLAVDSADHAKIVGELTKHHPLSHPSRDQLVNVGGETHIKVPEAFCRRDPATDKPIPETRKWVPGSLMLGLIGYGFAVIFPGGDVTIDATVPEKVVKQACPHLLTETEYQIKLAADAVEEAELAKAKQAVEAAEQEKLRIAVAQVAKQDSAKPKKGKDAETDLL